MKGVRKKFVRDFLRQLEAAGASDFTVEERSKHTQVRYTLRGLLRVVHLPRSPGEYRTMTNTYKDAIR